MRELIAGDGGSVLLAAAANADVVALACEGLAEPTRTPSGIPVYPADALPDDLDVDVVRLLPAEAGTSLAVCNWASARHVPWTPERVRTVALPHGIRAVSVSASSTGSGKTALTRRVARTLHRSSVSVAVARHPMSNLLLWDRFDPVVVRSPQDLRGERPVEEREELAPIVGAGVPVVCGLDADRVIAVAAREAGEDGVVVLDSGGAAEPWIEADVDMLVVDLLRGIAEVWRSRVEKAHAVVLTKADSAAPERARDIEGRIRSWNPDASIVLADLAVGVQPVNVLPDKRVVIVEDANSLILGGLSAGAGAVAARRFRCGVVDPRPFAIGAIAGALRMHAHIGAVIPSLGRTPQEIEDLAASVYVTPGDAVLWASNADPATVIPDEQRPIVRAFGELTEVAGPPLQDVLAPLLPGHA